MHHTSQMKKRCPKCRYIKKYILNGYQLTFRSKYGACDIEKKAGLDFNDVIAAKQDLEIEI